MGAMLHDGLFGGTATRSRYREDSHPGYNPACAAQTRREKDRHKWAIRKGSRRYGSVSQAPGRRHNAFSAAIRHGRGQNRRHARRYSRSPGGGNDRGSARRRGRLVRHLTLVRQYQERTAIGSCPAGKTTGQLRAVNESGPGAFAPRRSGFRLGPAARRSSCISTIHATPY
jgi:hypothetical protein